MRATAGLRASRARLVTALAACAGLLAACNILTGLDQDYVLGNVDAGPTGEGGMPEGSTGEGGGKEDAATDGTVGSDGGPARFCDGLQGDSGPEDFFCSDFDDVSVGTWDSITPNPAMYGATFQPLLDAGLDGSAGLDVDSMIDSGTRNLTVRKRFDAVKPANAYDSYHVDLEVRVLSGTIDYGALALLVFAEFAPPLREHGVALYGPGSPELSSEAPKGTAVAISPQWRHVRVRLDRNAAGTFDRKITIGAVTVDTARPHTIDAGAPTELRVGLFNTGTAGGHVHVQFDNVVFRRR